MDESSGSDIQLSGGCESESRVKSLVVECAGMNPCEESSSQSFIASESQERSLEGNSSSQNIYQEHISEQSDTALDDSSNEGSNEEEFADLLQRCFTKSESDIMMQSVSVEGDKETAGEGSAASNCAIPDAEEDKSAVSTVTQLTDAERSNALDMISADQPAQSSVQHSVCPLCQRNFSDFQGLKRHLNDRENHCTYFEKVLIDKSDLKQHIKHALGEGELKCVLCDFSSKYSQDLKAHISTVHLEEKPHKCPQCDLYFLNKSHLTRHTSSVHNHEKPSECSSCDKKFLDHSDDDLQCRTTHCEEKPLPCDQHDFNYSKKIHLSQQERFVHSSDKSYMCTECGKAFNQSSNLKNHINAVHKGLKPYPCKDCDGRFGDRSTLLRHVKNVHLKLKPYTCSVCHKSFSQNVSLRKHMDGHIKAKSKTEINASFAARRLHQ